MLSVHSSFSYNRSRIPHPMAQPCFDCQPLQEICKPQYIFLLELYIRCIKCKDLCRYSQTFCVPSAVAFGFLNFCLWKDQDLMITPVDPMFEPQQGVSYPEEPFFSGKSVLFALCEDDVASINVPFQINMHVVKKLPAEFKKHPYVADAFIDMSMHFAALRKELIERMKYPEDTILPFPSKIFDEEIPLCMSGEQVGTMCVYARISAYGKCLVTECDVPCPGFDGCFRFRAEQNCRDCPLTYDMVKLDRCCDLGGLGNKLPVRDCYECEEETSPECSEADMGNFGRVRHGGGRGESERLAAGEGCCRPPTEFRDNSCCESSDYRDAPCVGPIQTSRGPNEICGKAVVLKVSGLLDPCEDGQGNQQTRVTVTPESEATRPEDDPEHDIFILRIGKKGLVGAGEKSDIQLEMRTPKGPERRPPVRLETREMQTEVEKKGGKGGKKKK